jgi:outer membrane protein assembly factor BamB
MKRAKILLLAIITLLPLVLISCGGATQTTGGWSGPIVEDGIIYAGTRDGRVVAVNVSSRKLEWEWPDTTGLRSLIYTTPIVHGDLVYVGTYSGQVYALTLDRGAERWVYPRTGSIGAVVGRPVVVNETIYVASSDGTVYALDATYGDLKWKCELEAGKLWTSPTVMGDTLYVSTLDGHIYDLSLETEGLLGWSFEAEAGFASSPVVYEDDIYVGSFDRYLYAIEIGSNASMWKFPQQKPAGNWFWASPIVNEGIVYAGCLDGRLCAIEARTGEKLWEFDAGSPIVSSPVLMDTLLIITDESGTVCVFDVSTESQDEAVPLRTVSIGASVRSSFCAQNGLVYIRGEDNSIYVVDIEIGEIVEGWPVSLAAQT